MARDPVASRVRAAPGAGRGTILIVPCQKPARMQGRDDLGCRAVAKQVFAAASAGLDVRCGR